MKRLILFLGGLILMVLMFAALCVSGAIFDVGAAGTIDTYFFQVNGKSAMRSPLLPIRPSDIGQSQMRDMLIRKFVYEYFYAMPDVENIARRMRPGSTLSYLAGADVFAEWMDGPAIEIQDLAEARAMRTVNVIGEIAKPENSDYWRVQYELTTWYVPNDMDALPETTRGVIYVSVDPRSKPTEIWNDTDIEREISSGRDPATLFKFQINRVELH